MASSSSSHSPLLYACIAYNTTILAEHTTSAAANVTQLNMTQLTANILPKIDHKAPQKMSYIHQDNLIHYMSDAASEYPGVPSAGALTYMVVAASSLGRRVPFGFLFEVKKRFQAEFPVGSTDFASLPTYGCGSFNVQLKNLMVEIGTTKAGQDDAISNVKSEIDSVRAIMTKNIESVLERGEHINLLVDKTDRLGGSANDFRIRSRGLRRKMWWKNVKLMALLIVVVIFLLYLFVGFGCGLPGWSKCVG